MLKRMRWKMALRNTHVHTHTHACVETMKERVQKV